MARFYKRFGRSAYRKGKRVYRYARNNPQQALALAKSAWSSIRQIRGLVNSEMFKYDVASSQAVANTGSIINILRIGQGDGDGGRTGNSVLVRNIFARFTFTQHASAIDTLYRMILFVDKQQIGDTSPAVSDVLDSVSCLSPLNSNTCGRFQVLRNWYFHTSNARDTVKSLKFSKSLYHHVRFNGSAADDVQKGGIYLMLLSDQASNTPTCFYNIRVSYRDN